MTHNKYHMILFPWILVLYEIVIYLSMDAYMPALPDIASVFGISANLAQVTAITWMVGGFSLQLIFGPLSDRYGRRPILLYGGVLYIVASFICYISPNIQTLLIARFFQGAAMPAMFIAGYAAINELFDTKVAVHILARMSSITILAPAFGPILGGALLIYVDWRIIFLLLAIFALITIVLLFFIMPETAPQQQRQTKMNIKAIMQQYYQVITNTRFMVSALITFLPIVGMVAWMIAGPFIVTELFHHRPLDFGLIQALIFGGFIIGTIIVKRIANEKIYQRLINIGISISVAASILTLIIGGFFKEDLFALVIAIMIVCFGSGLTHPILSRLTLEESDVAMGIRVTIFSVIRIGAGVLGSVALAIFYNNTVISLALIILFFVFCAGILRIMQYYTGWLTKTHS